MQTAKRTQVIAHSAASARAAARDAVARIAPLWSLENFVAVNPFWGFKDLPFAECAEQLNRTTGAELYLPLEYYKKHVGLSDIDASVAANHHLIFGDTAPTDKETEDFIKQIFAPQTALTPASVLGTNSAEIVDEISNFLALYFDHGQAVLSFPLKQTNLFAAWRFYATTSLSSEISCGLREFRQFAAQLPQQPEAVIEALAAESAAPALEDYFSCLLAKLNGWASYIAHRVFEDSKSATENSELTALLAVIAAYELAVLRSSPQKDPSGSFDQVDKQSADQPATINRYILQCALEHKHREHILNKLQPEAETSNRVIPQVQALFCIDVRSADLRANLEDVSGGEIETYGFAGFFGLSIKYRQAGSSNSINQFPVLLSGSIEVNEQDKASAAQRAAGSLLSPLVKSLRQSVTAGFSYVEAFGLLYFYKLFKSSLIKQQSAAKATPTALEIAADSKIESAKAFLKNSGLKFPLADKVMIVGHHCTTENNPYASGLDCGACGGQSGGINARVAADFLNDPKAKEALDIPESTSFVPALHCTTTDQIEVLSDDPQAVSDELRCWLDDAAKDTREDRAVYLNTTDSGLHHEILKKAVDWSEVRPEWGLAGNTAFIIAGRDRTRGVKFGNQTFLHEYDRVKDEDLSVLELIMTAPMIVTNWINLQYYASAVDPQTYGAGNKVLHNVVGQLGVFEGNGGDLKTGLPFQSVHSGKELRHLPCRLQVFIEAEQSAIDSIINKHQMLRELVGNKWLFIHSII